MKTLADLKRDAKSGKFYGEMVFRYGEEIPERLKGKRKLVDANSACVKFLNADGKKSELRIKYASLIEYTGDELIIYGYAMRDLTEQESKIMQEWKVIEETTQYHERSRIDALSDGNQTYWRETHFFKDKGYIYLMGLEEQAGLKYDRGTGRIIDKHIRGEKELAYKISMDK